MKRDGSKERLGEEVSPSGDEETGDGMAQIAERDEHFPENG